VAPIDPSITLHRGDEVLMVGFSDQHNDGRLPNVRPAVIAGTLGGEKGRVVAIARSAGLYGGDSGGLVFLRKDGELKLVGVGVASDDGEHHRISSFTPIYPHLGFIEDVRRREGRPDLVLPGRKVASDRRSMIERSHES